MYGSQQAVTLFGILQVLYFPYFHLPHVVDPPAIHFSADSRGSWLTVTECHRKLWCSLLPKNSAKIALLGPSFFYEVFQQFKKHSFYCR